MTIQHHFSCATPGCKVHVHVTIVCHDDQKYDCDKLAASVGFQQRRDHYAVNVNPWHCETHVPLKEAL